MRGLRARLVALVLLASLPAVLLAFVSVYPDSVADHPSFQRAVALRSFAVRDFVPSSADGQTLLEVARPILNPAGRVESVLLLTLSSSWLNALALDTLLPDGANLILIDRASTVLARRPHNPDIVGRQLDPSHPLRSFLGASQPGTTAGRSSDGTPRLFAYAPLEGPTRASGAIVSVSIPEVEAFQEVNHITRDHLIRLVAVIVLALLAAWFGGERLVVGKIRRVARASERIAGGDLQARARLGDDGGELGLLGHAFDSMASQLQVRDREHRQLTTALEAVAGSVPDQLLVPLELGRGVSGRAALERRGITSSATIIRPQMSFGRRSVGFPTPR